MQPDGSHSSSTNPLNLLVPNHSKLPFDFDSPADHASAAPDLSLKIRIPPKPHSDFVMAPGTRTRASSRAQQQPAPDYASGSEYHESEPSMDFLQLHKQMFSKLDPELEGRVTDNFLEQIFRRCDLSEIFDLVRVVDLHHTQIVDSMNRRSV